MAFISRKSSHSGISGIFRKGEHNYQIIFRNVEGSLKLAYYMTAVIGGKVRTLEALEIPYRISYDNKQPQQQPGPTAASSDRKGPEQTHQITALQQVHRVASQNATQPKKNRRRQTNRPQVATLIVSAPGTMTPTPAATTGAAAAAVPNGSKLRQKAS